jgi:hypothetical protein
LSPIDANGASEKCEQGRNVVHISCTVFPHAPKVCNIAPHPQFEREFTKN